MRRTCWDVISDYVVSVVLSDYCSLLSSSTAFFFFSLSFFFFFFYSVPSSTSSPLFFFFSFFSFFSFFGFSSSVFCVSFLYFPAVPVSSYKIYRRDSCDSSCAPYYLWTVAMPVKHWLSVISSIVMSIYLSNLYIFSICCSLVRIIVLSVSDSVISKEWAPNRYMCYLRHARNVHWAKYEFIG